MKIQFRKLKYKTCLIKQQKITKRCNSGEKSCEFGENCE